MTHVIIFDCEFLTRPGAKSRMWCGPEDPDPCVVQIGAVKLSLEPDFAIAATEKIFIKSRDRSGKTCVVAPFFVELTGITQAQVDAEGVSQTEALNRLERFADGASLWSWGKDEFFLLAISCYVAGIAPSIAAHRFGNAGNLLLTAGMPRDDLEQTTSGQLAGYYGLSGGSDRRHHDALDDAISVALCLQHLLRESRLTPEDFQLPASVRS
ncbi:3'-5' exonuclease [Roseibium sediminicola]|uniref:Exonuclease domain-containing protein n=1 Tax=Roseibium sediminicola TaxID=2933272 RepID=A0ABT0GZ52_9HYPH|nr:3'-5' exonuclease [Roseibium sp. CAU 1639]MCK7614352.1 exonuclease domain-containing protein [Roseibium sp. CAU 1639]